MTKKHRPETPYEGLLKEAREYALAVRQASRLHTQMFLYPKSGVEDKTGWRLDHLAQRVQAAAQLGYDCVLVWEDRGLVVVYRKRLPDPPWRLQP